MTTPSTGECRTCCDPSCAGDGLIYDPTDREYDVRISNDPGNQIVFGSDGGILAPPVPGTETIVDDGNGINVTGGGSAVNPYIVSAEVDPAPGNTLVSGPAGLFVPAGGAVDDGNGINVTGTGATGDPFVVSVEISPAPGNIAQSGPNGVFVPATVVTGGDGVDVSGTGATGDPYVLDANEAELISPAAGNQLALNGGKLFVPATTSAPTPVVEGQGIDVTGAGTTLSPWNVAARLSADAGQALSFGSDGGLFYDQPDAAAPVVVASNPLNPEVTVTGTGTLADPYRVTHPPLVTPRARVRTPADVVLPKRVLGGQVIDTFAAAQYNRQAMWSAANPSRLTVPAGWDGIYTFGANAQVRGFVGQDQPSIRALFVRRNGNEILIYDQRTAVDTGGDSTMINISGDFELVAGDYLEMLVQVDDLPDAVQTYTLAASNNFSAAFWATFLHR